MHPDVTWQDGKYFWLTGEHADAYVALRCLRRCRVRRLLWRVNGLYKTELIRRQGPWRNAEHVELATLAWVEWFNHRRLHGELGDVPPAEFEAAHYARTRTPATLNTPTPT